MSKKFDVYGLGNALVDIQLQISEEEFDKLALKKGSMQLVDLLKQSQLIAPFTGQEFNRASGGSAANSMIAAAQLGAVVAFGGSVGDDFWGKYYCQEMEDLGITCRLAVSASQATGTSLILITPDAERTMNTHLGAAVELGAQHVSEELIAASKYLYLEGYLLSSESGREAAHTAVKMARENGTKVAVSLSAGFIAEVFRSDLEKILENSDLVIANTDEVKTFTRTDDEEQAFELFKKCAPNGVMTLRERGARVFYEGDDFIAPTPQVFAVDETGAGDVFAGTFLYGLTRANDVSEFKPRDVARLACFLASRVVMSLGPRLSGNVKLLLEQEGFA